MGSNTHGGMRIITGGVRRAETTREPTESELVRGEPARRRDGGTIPVVASEECQLVVDGRGSEGRAAGKGPLASI
jgi:hypothetical protein